MTEDVGNAKSQKYANKVGVVCQNPKCMQTGLGWGIVKGRCQQN